MSIQLLNIWLLFFWLEYRPTGTFPQWMIVCIWAVQITLHLAFLYWSCSSYSRNREPVSYIVDPFSYVHLLRNTLYTAYIQPSSSGRPVYGNGGFVAPGHDGGDSIYLIWQMSACENEWEAQSGFLMVTVVLLQRFCPVHPLYWWNLIFLGHFCLY